MSYFSQSVVLIWKNRIGECRTANELLSHSRSFAFSFYLPLVGVVVVHHKTFRAPCRGRSARAIVSCVYALCAVRVCTRVRENAPRSAIDAAVGGKSGNPRPVNLSRALPRFFPSSRTRYAHPDERERVHARARVGALGTFRRATERARSSRRAETTVASLLELSRLRHRTTAKNCRHFRPRRDKTEEEHRRTSIILCALAWFDSDVK